MTQAQHDKIRLHAENLDKVRRRLIETEEHLKVIDEYICAGRQGMVSVYCKLDGVKPNSRGAQFQVPINIGLIHAQMLNRRKRLESQLRALLPAGML